jgi:hypothetical protein
MSTLRVTPTFITNGPREKRPIECVVMADDIGVATAERSRMTTSDKAGHGPVEATVGFGVVSFKRWAMLAPGRGTALRAETGGHWGRLGLHAKCPERLFADLGREV